MGQEYLLLLKGGRRLSTKMETTLKSSLRNVVKFYDIFTYLACKQYEMKKKEEFLSDCLLYFSHAI